MENVVDIVNRHTLLNKMDIAHLAMTNKDMRAIVMGSKIAQRMLIYERIELCLQQFIKLTESKPPFTMSWMFIAHTDTSPVRSVSAWTELTPPNVPQSLVDHVRLETPVPEQPQLQLQQVVQSDEIEPLLATQANAEDMENALYDVLERHQSRRNATLSKSFFICKQTPKNKSRYKSMLLYRELTSELNYADTTIRFVVDKLIQSTEEALDCFKYQFWPHVDEFIFLSSCTYKSTHHRKEFEALTATMNTLLNAIRGNVAMASG